MSRALVTILLFLLPAAAFAQRVALTPQNRMHAGVSMVDMQAIGLTAGLDSRLTRIINVDAGGFLSPAEPDEVSGEVEPEELVFLRHGLFVAPGLRIPHRYGDGPNWDFAARFGFASVWSSDVSQGYDSVQADPALLAGADLLLRWDAVGMRAGGKGLMFKPFSKVAREELTLVRPFLALEGFYQW